MSNPFTAIRQQWSRELATRLGDAGARLKNVLANEVATVFGEQGVRDGEGSKWKPTTSIALQNRVNPVSPGASPGSWLTLVDTGKLEGSIAGDAKVRKTGLRIRVGTPLEYGATHQYGGWFYPEDGGERKPVPPRPFLFWTKSDLEVAHDMIAEELAR